jgi:hypothetical protein
VNHSKADSDSCTTVEVRCTAESGLGLRAVEEEVLVPKDRRGERGERKTFRCLISRVSA